MKKQKSLTKLKVQDILYPFYGSVSVYKESDGSFVGKFAYLPEEFDWENYYAETENTYPESINLIEIWTTLQSIMINHQNGILSHQYEKIEIIEVEDDGYKSYRRIVGVRDETDEEFAKRKMEIENEENRKVKEKEEKEKRKIENKKKLLIKLQKELS